MKCKACGSVLSECWVAPAAEEKKEISVAEVQCPKGNPFRCKECGGFHVSVRPIRDVVFIWPDAAPISLGFLILPEGFRERHTNDFAIILSAGPGYTKNGVFHPNELKQGMRVVYDRQTPWMVKIPDPNGNIHNIRMMGQLDVKGAEIDGQIQMFDDCLLVEEESLPDRTSSGLYLPPNPDQAPKVRKGVVVNAGSGRIYDEVRQQMTVKAGDKIIYPANNGAGIIYKEKPYYIIREDRLLGILED